jgi:hypothetical protein
LAFHMTANQNSIPGGILESQTHPYYHVGTIVF